MKAVKHMRNEVIKLSGATLRLPKRPHFGSYGPLMSLQEHEAWLDRDGEQHRLEGNCSIGRAALNTLVIDSPKVSRLHSIIHLEDNGAFWLIDLGSSNGTFLNKRRIHEPVRLRDQDEVNIGGNSFVFHQPRGKPSAQLKQSALATLQEVENVDAWLLVADIKNFTPLSRAMMSGDLANLVSDWLGSCKGIIERHRGTVNKYLGDGILAYWRDEPGVVQEIVATISALKIEQERNGPSFRFVVHFGAVAIGGVPSTREETLMGSEVNLVFRLEKLLASLGEPCAISDAARVRLGATIACRSLGEHDLKGFEKKRSLFAV
jgi:adenylate cyclase